MIVCEGTECRYGHCCVECDAQESQECLHKCTVVENMDSDKNIIMEYCQSAEWHE